MTKPLKRSGTKVAVALAVLAAGCSSPLERSTQQALRDEMVNAHRAYINAVAQGPVIQLDRPVSEVENELTPERREELEGIGGPSSYGDEPLLLGPDLLGGEETPTLGLTLQRAIQTTVRHNLEIEAARLLPSISQTQVTQAEAIFDAVYFLDLNYQNLDTPRPTTATGVSAAFGANRTKTTELRTGIRKLLTSGGEVRVETSTRRNFANPSFFGTTDDPGFTYYDSDLLVGITQPLLRNFGADVNRSQILLAESARRQSVAETQRQILETVFTTERAYWDLYFAQQRLLIQLRLLSRTIADRDIVRERLPFDASPVQMTEANSFVEIRRTEVIRARQELRRRSDALKRLINDPELPLSGETLLLPLESPADLPVTYSLLDAVTIAMRRRPELRRALAEIEDTAIRLRVADNQRLPQLNLAANIRYNGLGSTTPEAYENLGEGDYIDYLVGAQFEVPIGNRGPEALFRQRQLERQFAVVNYRRLTQDVILEVKDSLRQLLASWEIIGAARAARLAASDNLRALEEQERVGAALTPEFLLDLKLSTQQRLADTETQEVQALAEYNTAIARFYQSTGTLLERNGIEFDPTPEPRRHHR